MILKPLGFVQMTSLSSAVALTSIPNGAQRAHITAEAQNVRLRDDGTNPTTGIGLQIIVAGTASQPFVYEGDLSAVRVIEEAGSAKLNVSYYA
jgi:hypothetical protein